MAQSQNAARHARIPPIIIIGSLFFAFGFISWSNSVLIPYLKIACELNNFQSYLVAFAFYISYFVMAIPSALLLKRTGLKKGMAAGLIIIATGASVFIPAALTREYGLFLLGLFIQGSGLAILQTASNPYVIIIGPPESAARRISIMGVCNKIAGGIAPIILGSIALANVDEIKSMILNMDTLHRVTELDRLASRVIMPYMVIIAVLLLLSLAIWFSDLPEASIPKEERDTEPDQKSTALFKFPNLVLGVLAIFLYVGVEKIAGYTVISYASYQGIELQRAKFFTTFTLIGMIAGYFTGILAIPKYISQQNALKVCCVLSLLFTLGALFNEGVLSVIFITLLGLSHSLMWPAIFPLAIKGLGNLTRAGSSIMIMGISGGAVLPLIYGSLADNFNLQHAYWLLIPCYVFILFFAVKGHKIKRFI